MTELNSNFTRRCEEITIKMLSDIRKETSGLAASDKIAMNGIALGWLFAVLVAEAQQSYMRDALIECFNGNFQQQLVRIAAGEILGSNNPMGKA
jgi:hypothetical protein